MQVVFRVDASVQIGSGHVMRCLTLADRLRERGADVLFVCRELVCNLTAVITGRGYALSQLPAPQEPLCRSEWNRHSAWLEVDREHDAEQTLVCLQGLTERVEWLVVDHYALDREWEARMRSAVGNILVIDDLADRLHDCDLLLDQNLHADQETRYTGLVPSSCEQLLGPRFALLRPEFAEARNALKPRDGRVRRILVFLGVSDPGNATGKVLAALKELNRPGIAVDLVVGVQSPHVESLRQQCSELSQIVWHENVVAMASLMLSADLAIGGGGTTTWERCALELPTVIISLAENQTPISAEVAKRGGAIFLGAQSHVDVEHLFLALKELLIHPVRLKKIGMCAGNLVDTEGLNRVVGRMESLQ